METSVALLQNIIGDMPVEGGGYASGYSGLCIRVAAERHGFSDGVLVIHALKEADYGFRDTPLAADIKGISRLDLGVSAAEIVSEVGFPSQGNRQWRRQDSPSSQSRCPSCCTDPWNLKRTSF